MLASPPLLRALLCAAFLLGASGPTRAADYSVSYNPYAAVDWGTTLRCQSQHHDHARTFEQIIFLEFAGYCAVPYMTYSGAYRPSTLAEWTAAGSPDPDPGKPVGWGSPRHWPPTAYGAPTVPLPHLRFQHGHGAAAGHIHRADAPTRMPRCANAARGRSKSGAHIRHVVAPVPRGVVAAVVVAFPHLHPHAVPRRDTGINRRRPRQQVARGIDVHGGEHTVVRARRGGRGIVGRHAIVADAARHVVGDVVVRASDGVVGRVLRREIDADDRPGTRARGQVVAAVFARACNPRRDAFEIHQCVDIRTRSRNMSRRLLDADGVVGRIDQEREQYAGRFPARLWHDQRAADACPLLRGWRTTFRYD